MVLQHNRRLYIHSEYRYDEMTTDASLSHPKACKNNTNV